MCCDEPRDAGDRSQGEYDRNEDGAGAVGQALHGRARALSLLNHAGDLGQHGGFAQRLCAAGYGAVVIERAGQHAAPRAALERSGFAGEHRLVDCCAAFEDRRVNREALARQDENAVAGANLIERNDGLDAVDDATRCYWLHAGERIKRGERAPFGSRFERLAQQKKAENQEDGVVVDLHSRGRPDGRVRRVEERHTGSERHQRVHVGGAMEKAAPCVQEDAAAQPRREVRQCRRAASSAARQPERHRAMATRA